VGTRLAGSAGRGDRRGASHGRITAWRGAVGEELAARALRLAGYKILARRLATDAAEVDLVARCPRGFLVVIEVKTAVIGHEGEPRFRPGGHLGPSQLRRLERAARQLARRDARRPNRETAGSRRAAQAGGPPTRGWRLELVEVIVTPRGFRVEQRAVVRAPPADASF